MVCLGKLATVGTKFITVVDEECKRLSESLCWPWEVQRSVRIEKAMSVELSSGGVG